MSHTAINYQPVVAHHRRETSRPVALPDEPVSATALIYLRVSTSRQAHKNGEAEGYSIPAQRAACLRKARELSCEQTEEFVDAGASARSADRPGLQAMLERIKQGGVGYVIVHKLDRLARDRFDDVTIGLTIHQAGALLVSTSEQIDESPSGMLMHGIMATIAEFYSRNLSNEAKKGMEQKIKNGGTIGVAPIGYLNTIQRVNGRDIKGIAIDPERAPFIQWAYVTYAAGECSIARLTAALAQRGLRSRQTRCYASRPLSEAQIHRLLANPYYMGKLVHKGVIYDGAHPPLINPELWFQVQHVRANRRLAGDRSWKHDHYLKGTLFCGHCGARIGFGYSHGKGGTYPYLFCLARHTGRNRACPLPYLRPQVIEHKVSRIWHTHVSFSDKFIDELRPILHQQLQDVLKDNQTLIHQQQTRLQKLTRQKAKLYQAFLDDTIPAGDLKPLQARIEAEIADTTRLIRSAHAGTDLVEDRLDQVLDLLKDAGTFYDQCSKAEKQRLNQAMFERIEITIDNDQQPQTTGRIEEPISSVIHVLRQNQGQTRPKQQGTPDKLSLAEGSNLQHLAGTEGFEPSDPETGVSTLAGWCTKPDYATFPRGAPRRTPQKKYLTHPGRNRSLLRLRTGLRRRGLAAH